MKRLIFALLAVSATALSQSEIGVPLIGFIRDAGNTLRPVYGIAGNFILGEAAATGVLRVTFNGRMGIAITEGGVYLFNPAGRFLRRLEEAPPLACKLSFTGNTLEFVKNDGAVLRLELREQPAAIEQMSEDWFHVRLGKSSLAVRVLAEKLEAFQLPEAVP